MGWNIIEDNKELLILIYSGENSAQDIFESSKMLVDEAKKKNIHKYLCDTSELILTATKSDLFELPNRLYNEWGMDAHTRIAIIEPKNPHTRSMVNFYIYATQNLGWLAEQFSSRVKALKWLNEIQ